MRIRTTILGTVTSAAIGGLLALAPAAGAHQTFYKPAKLGKPASGGEPSIAASPSGVVMVASPQAIPSGLNGHAGTGLWISKNGGASFGKSKFIGSYLGGGDDDIIYDKGTWFEGDLEAAATEICQSTDNGKVWTGAGPAPDPNDCTTLNAGQAGPSDDRPWLAADPTDAKRVYLVYHEFVSAQPLAFSTTNGGTDGFANPCGPMVTDPAIEQNIPQDVTGGTLVARPVVDKKGNLYVLFATTTQQQNAAASQAGQPSGTFSQLYLAVSHDHCQSFTDYTVFDGSKLGTNTVQFGDIFNDLSIDGAGNLYAVGVGFIGHKAFAKTANVYLLSSKDHGQKWTKPVELASPKAAHMLPAAVGGPRSGQLAIGYFRTMNGVTDPNDLKGRWTYATAESTNATSAHPHFTYADVRPGYSYHNGQICNAGILCGLPGEPSDRSLVDFTSATLGAHHCPLFVFAGNPEGKPSTNTSVHTFNYVARQRTACFRTKSVSKHVGRQKRVSHHPRRRRRGFTG